MTSDDGEENDECDQKLVNIGNHARNIGALNQQVSGVFFATGAGAVVVTGGSGGYSSPVTAPITRTSVKISGHLATIGTVVDFGGASLQAVGTGIIDPLKQAETSYLGDKAIGKFFPKINNAKDGTNVLIDLLEWVTCQQL